MVSMSVVLIVSFPVFVDFQMIQGQWRGSSHCWQKHTDTSQTSVNLNLHNFAFNDLCFLFDAHRNTASKGLGQSFCLRHGQREDFRGSNYRKGHVGTKRLRHPSRNEFSAGGGRVIKKIKFTESDGSLACGRWACEQHGPPSNSALLDHFEDHACSLPGLCLTDHALRVCAGL
jgi:hypothetical protein